MKGRRAQIGSLLRQRDVTTLADVLRTLAVPQDVRIVDAIGDPEDWFVVGQRRRWGGISIGGLAANFSEVVLFNASTITEPGLIIVEGSIATDVAGCAEMFAVGLTTAAFFPQSNDTQWGALATTEGGFGRLRAGQNAARVGTPVQSNLMPLNIWLPTACVLAPQTGTGFGGIVVNVPVGGIWWWRELELIRR